MQQSPKISPLFRFWYLVWFSREQSCSEHDFSRLDLMKLEYWLQDWLLQHFVSTEWFGLHLSSSLFSEHLTSFKVFFWDRSSSFCLSFSCTYWFLMALVAAKGWVTTVEGFSSLLCATCAVTILLGDLAAERSCFAGFYCASIYWSGWFSWAQLD